MENQANSFSNAAGRYAKSIFQLANEKKIMDEVEKNFLQIHSLFSDSKDFVKFVTNPTIQKNTKLKSLKTYQLN